MPEIHFTFDHGLLFIPATLNHNEKSLTFKRCILDTGSAGTTFEASLAEKIEFTPAPESKIRFLTSIGGQESVYTRTVNAIGIAGVELENKHVEFGDLETRFHIDGIIGNDLLQEFKVEICYKEQVVSLRKY
jgi:hypothetical protein